MCLHIDHVFTCDQGDNIAYSGILKKIANYI